MKEPCVFYFIFLRGLGLKGRFAVKASGGIQVKVFSVIRVVQVILFEKNKAQDLYRRRAPWSFPRCFFPEDSIPMVFDGLTLSVETVEVEWLRESKSCVVYFVGWMNPRWILLSDRNFGL